MKYKYWTEKQEVIAKDGDRHIVTPIQLIKLYGVKPSEVWIKTEDEERVPEGLIKLVVKPNGNYKITKRDTELCVVCGEEFTIRRHGQKYCDNVCREAAYRKNNRGMTVPQVRRYRRLKTEMMNKKYYYKFFNLKNNTFEMRQKIAEEYMIKRENIFFFGREGEVIRKVLEEEGLIELKQIEEKEKD